MPHGREYVPLANEGEMKLLQALLLVMPLASSAHGAEPSTADLIASATFIPPAWSLSWMTTFEWCRTVDAALANPHTDDTRRKEYIATGQAHLCPHLANTSPTLVYEIGKSRCRLILPGSAAARRSLMARPLSVASPWIPGAARTLWAPAGSSRDGRRNQPRNAAPRAALGA
jgi:hypothetical protein